jgi:hypothetical protein
VDGCGEGRGVGRQKEGKVGEGDNVMRKVYILIKVIQ